MNIVKIPDNSIKSGISEGCFKAVASRAGISTERVDTSDDYGVDFHIKKMVNINGKLSAGAIILGVQLKSSKNWELENGFIKYHLRVKTYNDIVQRNIDNVTRVLLVIMCLNEDENNWCDVCDQKIKFQNSLFWYEIDDTELSRSNPDSTKLIRIPITQVLTTEKLIELFEKYNY